MKICLINPSHEESLDPMLDPPLGLLYIASILRNLNYDISILDLSFYKRETWNEIIPLADIYGITVYTASYHRALLIRDICKKINPNCRIIVGGPHPSSLTQETSEDFDIVCVGDGEGIIEDIIKYVELSNKLNNNMGFPKIFYGNEKLMNIDDISFPARDLLPIKDYTRTVYGEKATSIIASRGCIYRCNFCQNSKRTEKVRFRRVDNVILEMKDLISKYNFKAFQFYDDTFTIHPKIDELLEKMKELNIIFRCNGDTRRNRYELFEKLYDAGCREIAFGIESGSQKILDQLNKRVKISQNYLAIIDAKKAGLNVKAFIMVGSPGESWDTVKETVKFMNNAKPQTWTVFNFVPLPGCNIFSNPEKYGIKIITKDYRKYFNIAEQNVGGIVCETEFMTAEEIAEARQYMITNFPKQQGPLQDYYVKLDKGNQINVTATI